LKTQHEFASIQFFLPEVQLRAPFTNYLAVSAAKLCIFPKLKIKHYIFGMVNAVLVVITY